jgi:hypothetical protein
VVSVPCVVCELLYDEWTAVCPHMSRSFQIHFMVQLVPELWHLQEVAACEILNHLWHLWKYMHWW